MALYSFTSNNEQELSFEKGDRLEIIERPPSDPEWYRARDSRGHVGLVPRNYLQELADYLTQPYRCAASLLLLINPDGNSTLLLSIVCLNDNLCTL